MLLVIIPDDDAEFPQSFMAEPAKYIIDYALVNKTTRINNKK